MESLKAILNRFIVPFMIFMLVCIFIYKFSHFHSRHKMPLITDADIQASAFHMPRDANKLQVSWPPPQKQSPTIYCLANQTKYILVETTNASKYAISSSLGGKNAGQSIFIGYRIFENTTEPKLHKSAFFKLPTPLQPAPLFEHLAHQTISLAIQCPSSAGEYKLKAAFMQENVGWQDALGKASRIAQAKLLVGTPYELSEASDADDWAKHLSLAAHGLNRQKRDAVIRAYRMARIALEASQQEIQVQGQPYKVHTAYIDSLSLEPRVSALIERTLAYLPFQPQVSNHWFELFFNTVSPTARRYGGAFDNLKLPIQNKPLEGGRHSSMTEHGLWPILAVTQALDSGHLDPMWLFQRSPNKLGFAAWHPTFTYNVHTLHSMLDFEMNSYWHVKKRCLLSAHTADSGQYNIQGYQDSKALQRAFPDVCSLYSQALLYQTLESLKPFSYAANHSFALSKYNRFGSIEEIQDSLLTFIESKLWQPEKGFYKLHKHDHVFMHEFDESNTFALAGHVMLLESKMLPPKRHDRVIQTLLNRQKEFNEPTISTTLLPSYGDGVFESAKLDRKGEFENGGEWDEWGARAALQIYPSFPETSVAKLAEIAEQVLIHQGFYRWRSPHLKQKGGAHSTAAAAAYFLALHQGPFRKSGSIARRQTPQGN